MKKHLKILSDEILKPGLTLLKTLPQEDFLSLPVRIFNHFHKDSLYRNSLYLMTSTFITAFLGFIFWIIYARIFTSQQIGLTTTILSTTGLISILSEFGLSQGIVKFLSTIKQRTQLINTVITINFILSLLISVIFITGIQFFSPKLAFLQTNNSYLIIFIINAIVSSINIPIESVFLGERKTIYILYRNIIFSIIKLILPLAFVNLGSLGLFASLSLTNLIVFLISTYWLITKFNHRLSIHLDLNITKKIFNFTFINYISGFISQVPMLILPLVLTNYLSAESAAYFYFVMMINNFIKIIPSGTTQSLFAEGSNDITQLRINIIKAVKIMFLILIPVIIGTVFFGQYILLAFGKEYSTGGTRFLQILAFSNIFTAVNYLLGIILKIKDRIYSVLFMCFISSAVEILLGFLFLQYGLIGLGYAWILGEAITTLVFIYIIFIKK